MITQQKQAECILQKRTATKEQLTFAAIKPHIDSQSMEEVLCMLRLFCCIYDIFCTN